MKRKEKVMTSLLCVVLLAGVISLGYCGFQGISYVYDGGSFMAALTVFASVCVICATVIYLMQAEQSGRNRVAKAEAEKKVERILRADRTIDHK